MNKVMAIFLKTIKIRLNLWQRILPLILTYNLSLTSALAQGDSVRVYTEEHPLVYEDVWDLWPYSFLNDKGEPDGYNVDLIRTMMDRLNIPYVIKMKSSEENFNDLKNGKSDLTLGLAVGYHDEYGLYGKNAVTLFTQSVVTPSSKPVQIKTFRDLGIPGQKVIVNRNSMCYHLMLDYGWGENAVPEEDIREVIQRMSATEEGQIVWNTLTLKWLMQRYLIDNLQLTPVNMPHGEYKFMSNDQHLLDLLDNELTKMEATEELKPLQDKWFYPEHNHEDGTPQWMIYASIIAGVVLLVALVYLLSFRIQNRRLTRTINRRNQRLSLVLQTCKVRIWTYKAETNEISWRNENGKVAFVYPMNDFSNRYSAEDFEKLKAALEELTNSQRSAADKESQHEREITLELKAKDIEDGLDDIRNYLVALSVLRRDKNGKATVIIGTEKDITQESEHRRLDEERTMRYWSIFNSPVVGITLFDKDGRLVNINQKACDILNCNEKEILSDQPTLNDFIDLGGRSLEECDGYYASHFWNIDKIPVEKRKIRSIRRSGRFCAEIRLITISDDQLIGIFAIVRDVTESVRNITQRDIEQQRLDNATAILRHYNSYIDSVLDESDVRLATYSPDTHTLTIHRHVGEVQHALTQTRCMTLVDDYSKNLAMRTLTHMDAREDKDFRVDILTTLRIRGGRQLAVTICLMPLHNKQGKVVEYLGLLRDRSEYREVMRQLEIQAAKVQEVENTKNRFIKNMVQEIRTPMNTVASYVEQFNPDVVTGNEAELSEGILKNGEYLLHLIDNILYLSRLQARMVEIVKKPRNFAELFEFQCTQGWLRLQNANTRYIVENPYEMLVVDIDAENLGQAIRHITANAAQHTKNGIIRARYDYIGRRLIISVDDTGEGMSPEQLARMNDKNAASQVAKGLGLAITKELIEQMDGTVDISSELGSGTTVYIMLPCHASIIKRKKLA